MALAERIADLEERVTRLEAATSGPPADAARPPDHGDTFWALEGLRRQAPAGGAVLFTGLVDLPDGRHYEWQQAHPAAGILGADLAAVADSLAALGSGVRLRLLHAVLAGSDTAAALAELDGMGTTGRVYHHARILTGAGWLRRGPDGRYAVPGERVVPLLVLLAGATP